MTLADRLLLVAIDAFAAFAALGLVVRRLRHSAFDLHGARLRGRAVELAVIFTASGRTRPLTILAIAGFAIFAILRWPLWIPVGVLLSQITSQAAIEAVKRLYGRLRPADYLVRKEYGFSFPSGHAASAVTFYATWGLVTLLSPAPLWLRVPLALCLCAWGAGVAWSRLALSAHFVTDVLGGAIFGVGWMSLMLAIAAHMHAWI